MTAIINLKYQRTHQHIIFKTCNFNKFSIQIILLCSLFAHYSLNNQREIITIKLRAAILINRTLTAHHRSRIPLYHHYSVLLLMHMHRSPRESIILNRCRKVTRFSTSNRIMQQTQLRR